MYTYSEYTSRELQQFCSEKDIITQYTVAYNPEINGVVERMNRTLVDKSKAILADSCLGKEFLGDAVLYSTYVTNRSPTVGKTKTPYELWMECKPNVSNNIRAFGSIAYNHVPKQLRTKLDNPAKKMIMIYYIISGFINFISIYKLYDEENKKTVIGKNVIFNEKEEKSHTIHIQAQTEDK